MAAGDVAYFNQFRVDIGRKVHNLHTDEWKVGFITSAVTPSGDDEAPHWGGTGTTNYASSQVTPGGNYATGGVVLSDVSYAGDHTTPTVPWLSGKITIAQDASNPTNARWGILYNNTDSNKRAVAFLDFGNVRDMSAASFEFRFNSVDGVGSIAMISSPA